MRSEEFASVNHKHTRDSSTFTRCRAETSHALASSWKKTKREGGVRVAAYPAGGQDGRGGDTDNPGGSLGDEQGEAGETAEGSFPTSLACWDPLD